MFEAFDHSRATSLVKLLNDILLNTDSGNVLSLYFSAAFDPVNHNTLQYMEFWVGLSGSVLNWFQSYLKARDYFVSNPNYTSGRAQLLGPEFPEAPFSGLFWSTSQCSH